MTDLAVSAERPRVHLATLVIAAAVATLATTMFVPSIPSLALHFEVSQAAMQLGLSAFLVVLALTQLSCGPLSDLWGRRPVMIGGMAMFVAGSVMCLWAPSFGWFLLGRMVQAASAAGLILARTILRDLYDRDRAASMIGYTVMAMAVAPMVGPWIGGVLDETLGWEASFWTMTAIGVGSLALIVMDLPETNRSRGRPLREQVGSYRSLLRMPLLWLYVATGGCASAIYYAFLGGAAQLASGAFGMTPAAYGAWFAFCAGGYVFGNFLSGRFAEAYGLGRMVVAGAVIGLAGPILIVASVAAGWTHPFALFGWIALVGVGNGMILPSNLAAAISLRPDAAGAASGLAGTIMTVMGACAATLAAWIVGDGAKGLPFAILITAIAVVATGLALATARSLRAA